MFRLRLAYSLVAAIFVGASAFGQVTTGTPPLGSFGGGPFDTVNLGNLNVHFSIPVVSKAGRGMPFTYALSYDSSIWTQVTNNGVTSWFPTANWGWKGDTEIATGYVSYDYSGTVCDPRLGKALLKWSNFVYHDPFGTSHAVGGLAEIDQCQNTKLNLTSTARDGSDYTIYYYVDGSGTDRVTSRSGSVINPPFGSSTGAGTATDANGNQITTDGSGKFYDTLSGTTAVLTVAGTSPKTFTYTSPSGNKAYSLNYSPQNVWTSFLCSGIGEYQMTNVSMVSSIGLPDGTQYTFTYEQNTSHSGYITGRLASVTLPTGGTISYAYTGANGGINCTDGSTIGLTRAAPDSSTPWTYSRSGSGSTWTTTVTDPLTNETIVSFEKDSSSTNPTNNFFETQRVVKQGSNTLSTTITCYNGVNVGTPSSCYNTAVTSPIARATAFHYLPTSSGSQAETDTDYNSNGLMTDVYDYDYATGSVGALLRHTHLTYATLGNGIVDRPSSVSTYDGGGNLKANTQYTYDEGSLTASGATQHVSITGSRGNLTTLAAQASGTTTLYRKFSYYDTGIMQTSSDVSTTNASTNPTTYNYSSSAASCDFAFPTSITEPLSLSRSMTWDCNGGVLLTTKDENQQQTTYSYDVMWRTNQVNYPDGGEVTTGYNLSSNPANITVNQLIDSSGHWLTTQTNLDGLGRVLQQQRTSDPNGTSYVDTTYDALGRLASTSNPYYSSGDPTYGVMQYAYDALGRVTTITNPDSSQRLTAYSGAWANVQDEGNGTNRVVKLYQRDGLGRLITVCEVSSATQMGNGSSGSPQNCGAYGATGFLATYTYDALGNITYMTQGAQNRTFNYDRLSRLTLDANPETWGPTTYSYDTVTAGDLYQRSQPKQNLASGNGNWTATYTFDSLHRMTGVSYNDGTTPSAQWIYDSSSPWGKTATNPKGRLVATRVNNATTGALIAGEGFITYDPMGRVQWRLQNGQGSEYDLNYTYDFLGNVRTATNGAGVTLSSTYNTAAELSGVTSSLNDTNHPGTLFEGPQYNALGQVTTDNLGFLNEHYGYTNRGWLYSYWACMVPGVSCSNSQMAYTFNMQTGNNQQPLGFAPDGNIQVANDWINGNWTYTYDDFNRLSTSYCGTNCPGAQSALGFNYLYDRFGNRWQQNGTAGSGPHPQYSFDGNGHINSGGVYYDAAGNMIGDSSHSYIYDAENRVVQVDGTSGQCSSAAACYVYNASRQRVTKTTSAGTVYYVYDIAGHQVAEFSSSGAWNRGEVYAGSKHLATYVGGTGGSTYLNLADWVGTERMRVNSKQSPLETCTSLPFGDMQSCTGADESPMHFTGQQWDSEDNLTAFWFRTDSTTQGRWGSMDPSGLAAVDPGNPQTWNRYAYVGNNPLTYVDPLGLFMVGPCGADGSLCGGDGGGGFDPCFFSGLFCGGGPPQPPIVPPNGPPRPPKNPQPPPKPPVLQRGQPQCFAQLKTRGVNDPTAQIFGGTHSFWYVQDTIGNQQIVSGGPAGQNGNRFLDVWTNPDVNSAVDNVSATTSWNSGLSSGNCNGTEDLLTAADTWPQDTIPYLSLGPNSNSVANYLGQAGGFSPSPPSGSFGWNIPILFPGVPH